MLFLNFKDGVSVEDGMLFLCFVYVFLLVFLVYDLDDDILLVEFVKRLMFVGIIFIDFVIVYIGLIMM